MIEKQYFIILFSISIFALGIGMTLLKNLVHIAFSFLGILLSIAALFVLANAEFIAVTQLLIYVGGILILILFGTMLTANYSVLASKKPSFSAILIGLVFVFLFFGLIYVFLPYVGYPKDIFSIVPRRSQLSTQQIGIELITKHALLFEISGILLLVALVSAAFIASKKVAS